VTDSNGTFRYRPGERIAFSIGDLVLPTVTAAEIVTPKTLAGTSALDAPLLNNILTLLQSLDSDGNPSNGITISDGARAAVSGQAAAALQTALEEDTPTAFAARAELVTAVAASGTNARVVDPVEARRHFAQTLAEAGDESPLVTEVFPITWGASLTLPAGEGNFFVNQPARIRVLGQALSNSLSVVGNGACAEFIRDASKSSATQAEFVCTPSNLGPLDLRVEANGQTLASFSDVAVNPPVVRLDITVPAQAQANPQTAEKSGTLDIVLAPGNAPITVINFLRHVEEGYYPSTVFHRVYPGFMIQAGGLTYASNAYANKQAIFPPIPLERTTVTDLSNIQFSVAMARTSAVNSATSQFFINVADNSATLDADGSQAVDPGNGYAVFGELTASSQAESQQTIDLLNAILAVPKSPSGEGTQPLNPPVITGATRIR
jgi:cyclophilin family peptidyl-prolyl cis-trans isomerase